MNKTQDRTQTRIAALVLVSIALGMIAGCGDKPKAADPIDSATERRNTITKLLEDLKSLPEDSAAQTLANVRRIRMALTRSEESLILNPIDARAKALKKRATRLLLAKRKPGQLVLCIEAIPSEVMSVRFSKDGMAAITTHPDSTAWYWNLATRTRTKIVSGANEHLADVLVSADSLYRIALGTDDAFRLLEARSGKVIRTFAGHTGGTTHAVFSPDGRAILTSGKDGSIKLWWMGRDDTWRAVPEVAPPTVKTITQPPSSVITTKPTKKPSKSDDPEEKAPTLAGVKLQSTLMGRFSTAIINGNRVRVGDVINGWKITKIGSGFIELQWKEKMHVLYRDMSPTKPLPRRR